MVLRGARHPGATTYTRSSELVMGVLRQIMPPESTLPGVPLQEPAEQDHQESNGTSRNPGWGFALDRREPLDLITFGLLCRTSR